jgi:uroporphyrinogen decarboxylase
MYEKCKKSGCAVFIHSCGNITELIPDLIEMGVDVVDPIQPEVMDLKFIKKEYGRDIVFFGGVGAQSTLPLSTPEQVVNEIKRLLGFMNNGGKFILGPSGAISTDTPVENIVALIEFCKKM